MLHQNIGIRVGGAWLALAAVLMAAALAMHGPIAPDPADQMVRIAGHASAWVLAHWLAAAGLSFYVVAGLILLASRSSLTATPWTLSAWAVVVVGGLWTINTAVSEATVVTDAAMSRSSEMFAGWWAFAEGKANGFAFLTLALAAVARSDARDAQGATPSWAAWTAMVAGMGSFAGWVLGMWFDMRVGSLLWLASSILLSVWTAWFGVGLARSPVNAPVGA